MGGLGELVNGMAVGATRAIDGGYVYNLMDRWTGAGDGDPERAVPTISAKVAEAVYDGENRLDHHKFGKVYAPRFVGEVVGGGVATAGLLSIGYLASPLTGAAIASAAPGIYTAIGTTAAAAATYAGAGIGAAASIGIGTAAAATVALPILAGAAIIPAVTGLYGLGANLYKTVRGYIKGEHVDGNDEKASIGQGFRAGYEWATHHRLSHWFHRMEERLALRGRGESHIHDKITTSHAPMRRNFRAKLGYGLGRLVGGLANLCTLGLLGMYKSSQSGVRQSQDRPWQSLGGPRHVFAPA